MNKNTSTNSINKFCSSEQLEKFIGKVCVWNLTFMDRPLSGKLIEVNENYFLIEMRDGRTLVAGIGCVLGFGMAKRQPKIEGEEQRAEAI